MTTKIPVPVICVCICIAAAAICIIGAVSFIAINNSAENSGNAAQAAASNSPSPVYAGPLSPTAAATSNQQSSGSPSGNPAPSYTSTPPAVNPTASPTPVFTQSVVPTQPIAETATTVPTPAAPVYPTVTATPAPVPTLTPLQQEGISLITGKWHGDNVFKVLFVSVSGTFDAVCNNDFTAVLSGKIPYGGSDNNFVLPVTWEYLGSQNFIAKTGDGSTLPFTCNGNQITMYVNPYEAGLTDNPLANTNIEIKLYKI